MELVFNKNIEEVNKVEIEKYLKPFQWLIPGWLQILNIHIEPSENENLIASMCVQERYREANLTIRPLFFTKDDLTKKDAIVHELIHIHTNPIHDFSKNAMRKFSGSEIDSTMAVVFDEMECYLERQTQDLAFAILNKFNER